MGHICEVLEIAFESSISDVMPICGSNKTWTYTGNGLRLGKQEHMASMAKELMMRMMLGVMDVKKKMMLLNDDDPRNVKKCLRDGMRAVWLNPMDPSRFLDDIILLE
jgi:hypothetical protein